VDATFEDGKVNMIIGQSGSGKTVLLKSLIGIHTITSGRIEYDGRNLPDMKENEVRMLHREVGVLFQGSALFDSMTVLENVLFPLRMFGKMSQSEMEERARFCLKRVQIAEHALELMPSEISGGMQKRVAIARAIALNPKYLFCDEPNSGLDPQTSLVIDKLIQEITQEYNICTIVNTHDMNSIMEVGDNIIFLKGGKKEWEGSRNEIFHADNEALNNFVFASQLYQEIRKVHK
jgi:phospholipid/cholesterol/gamma-HCH transport system ATP-binding protein